VVIFSHGYGGSRRSFGALSTHWAGHGFVVISVEHADSGALRRPGPDAAPTTQERAAQGAQRRQRLLDNINNPGNIRNRVQDVVAVIDSLDDLALRAPNLAGRVDTSRIAVAGHSFGAYTAQVIGGARLKAGEDAPVQSLADERVDAVILISGQGTGQQGLHEASWKQMRPMLVIGGSRDSGAAGHPPAWRMQAFDHSPPGEKYRLFIANAGHITYGTNDPNIVSIMNASTLAFLHTYLKDDAEARKALNDDLAPWLGDRADFATGVAPQ
jgi:predicted dienelactone hydrolase